MLWRVLLIALLPLPVWGQSCIELNGKVQQGALLWGQVDPGSTVTLDGEALDVSPEGLTLMGFDRDAKTSAVFVVVGKRRCKTRLTVASRNYNIQRVEGVPQRTVTPDEADLQRIRQEGALVVRARRTHSGRLDFVPGFIWPLEGILTGHYGSQRYYNGEPGRPHYGVDVAAATGTEVRAPANGVVTLVHDDMFYSGGTLILDHGMEVSSSFLHLSKILVEEGAEVRAGDIIAEVGATGRATGPHLDWRMNWRDRRIDPQLLAPPMPKR